MAQRVWEGGEGTPQGGKLWVQVQTEVQGESRQTAEEAEREKKKKKEKHEKKKKRKKGKKRAEAGGSAQNSTVADQSGTEDEEDQPRTVERRIYRRQKTRKLRKLNDGGKLEIVQVKTHSSDYSDMILRPQGQKRRKNERGARVTTDEILECEGGRLVP